MLACIVLGIAILTFVFLLAASSTDEQSTQRETALLLLATVSAALLCVAFVSIVYWFWRLSPDQQVAVSLYLVFSYR